MSSIVGTTDILWTAPYLDPDVSAYAETASGKELELRVAATPAGAGALIVRRDSVNQIVAAERTGRQLDPFTATTNTASDTNVTAAAYSATNPTGYDAASSLEIQATGASSTDRGTRKTCAVGASDLSVFSGGAMFRFHRRCTSVTNLVRWVFRFEFATTSDYAEYSAFEAADALNTWAEITVAKGNPRATAGTVNWALWNGKVRIFADVSGAYTGNLEVRDLRLGTVQTAKTVPDGYIAAEASVDARARYRDDATPKLSTTLAASSAAAATNVKLTAVTNLVAGDDLTLVTAGFVETRTITVVGTAGAGGTGVTVSEAFTYAHTSGETAAAYYWGPWSPWVTVKASIPPTVAASSPADAATVTDPTPALVHTFSSPGGKAQASRTLRLYLRLASVDQLIRTTATAGTGLTETLPRLLLATGATYAWELDGYDTDGLYGTTTRRTFTTSFSVPAALTTPVATADPENGAMVLTWDASVDANFDHYRVYWRDPSGNYVRVDGGPAVLDDGLTPLTAATFTHYGANLGVNEYQITQHNGWGESDVAYATGTLTEAAGGGQWMVVDEADGSRYTFAIRVTGAPRTHDSAIERFAPPGRGSTVHLKWGVTGRRFSLTIRQRPVVDGDQSTLFHELLDGSHPVWIKAPAGWLFAPCWSEIVNVVDTPGVGGMLDISVEIEETER